MASKRLIVLSAAVAAVAAMALGGCTTVGKVMGRDDGYSGRPLFEGRKKNRGAENANLGVNSFLWRATLDTLAFMPLASADPYGGTIITDWYSNPEAPSERFKVTVFILDTRLRADGLKVTVYKETRGVGGGWVTANTAAQTETDIQNAILTKARQLRLSNVRG